MRLVLSCCLLFGVAACGAAQPAPAAVPAGPTAPEPTPDDTPPPPRASSEAPPPDCPSDHVWDSAAAACRLFPGGGYGWAGCSQAKAPPNGEACITGTHWQECDCKCDAAGAKWNATSKRCE